MREKGWADFLPSTPAQRIKRERSLTRRHRQRVQPRPSVVLPLGPIPQAPPRPPNRRPLPLAPSDRGPILRSLALLILLLVEIRQLVIVVLLDRSDLALPLLARLDSSRFCLCSSRVRPGGGDARLGFRLGTDFGFRCGRGGRGRRSGEGLSGGSTRRSRRSDDFGFWIRRRKRSERNICIYSL
jgi:hypothetical protein